MAALDPLSLFVRWAHVVGMAAILGGAILVALLTARRSNTDAAGNPDLEIAIRYEWIFWVSIGVQAMTGVGNLGAFGQNLPASTTGWGVRLSIKLAIVLVLAFFSVPRTLAVALLTTRSNGRSTRAQAIPILYGATVMLVLVIVALAVWLAHG